jgi:hypothetical protein
MKEFCEKHLKKVHTNSMLMYFVPKRFCAITLFEHVFIRKNTNITSRLLVHELKHALQQNHLGMTLFSLLYLFFFMKNLLRYKNLHKSYMMIPFEISARQAANCQETRVAIIRVYMK